MLLDNNDAPTGYDARVRHWYTEALKSPDKVVISPPYQDIKTKDWVISLSKPIIDGEGVLKGVAAVDFNLEFASELM